MDIDSAPHFERMVLLTRRLAEQNVCVRGHEYDPHFFGMWKIVAGPYEHQFRFLWDARDQVMTVSETYFKDFCQQGDWKQIREVVIDARKGADPFKFVEDFFAQPRS